MVAACSVSTRCRSSGNRLGCDTTRLKTTAVRKGDRYVVNGQKVWISRVQHSDLMVLLARTTPLADVLKKSEGMSVFIVDVKSALAGGMTVRPIPNMVNHETNELFFDNLELPAENLIGEEGRGFKYILDGLNAERTLIAAECIGDGYWFIERAAKYANERIDEYDVERKFRETRLYQVAPISTNLIFSYVAEHVLGLPRSF